ncbi:MAG: hypothetical protein LBM97_00635 [Candidatus Nomurabacteria bacterium]|jgi:hypothetical protein|nr:hypothetical protein [Candidatus Nomurabacteria bacterium]
MQPERDNPYFNNNAMPPIIPTPVPPAPPTPPIFAPAPPAVTFATIASPVPIVHKKMSKIALATWIVAGVLFAGGITVAMIARSFTGNSGGSSIFADDGKSGTRTMMIYMIGSDLESEGGMGSEDIEEIVSAEPGDDVKIVVYAGGAEDWHNGWKNNTVYEYKNGDFVAAKSFAKQNSASSAALTEFLQYAYKNYKSDLYDLIFWDHGSGPVVGFGADELYEDETFNGPAILSLGEIGEALEKSDFSSKNKLEVVGFDACLMATIETASMLSEYADYLVASEETEPGYGWDYSFLTDLDKKDDTTTFAKSIVDYYAEFYVDLASQYWNADFEISLSVLDLSEAATVNAELDKMFSSSSVITSAANYSGVTSSITKSVFFGGTEIDLVDLYSAVKQLELRYDATNARSLLTAIEKMVAYQKTNISGANGVSVYYPYYQKQYASAMLSVYNKVVRNFSPNYKSFLGKQVVALTGERKVNWNARSATPKITSGEISVGVNESLAENYSSANYVIFAKTSDGEYAPVYKSSDVVLEDGELRANFDKKQFVSSGSSEAEYNWVTMYEHRKDEDSTIYRIPAMLFRADGFKMKSINVEYSIDNKSLEGRITAYVPLVTASSEMGAVVNREVIDLSEWDTISLLNFEYAIFDADGNYTSDWGASGKIFGTEYKTDEEIEIRLEDLEVGREYYCLFQVYDTQGNQYATNVVKL